MKQRTNLFGPRFRAEQLPYGYFVKPPDGDLERGVIWLRPGGHLIGWKIRGLPFESTSAADVAAVCGQFGASLGLTETGDCLTLRIDRVKAPDYPLRDFQIEGAGLIDRERGAHIQAGNSYRNIAQIWWATQFERAVPNLLKSLFFRLDRASDAGQPRVADAAPPASRGEVGRHGGLGVPSAPHEPTRNVSQSGAGG